MTLPDQIEGVPELNQAQGDSFTIQNLIDHAVAHPSEFGISKKSMPSYVSTLKKFSNRYGMGLSSLAASILIDQFEENLAAFGGTETEQSRLNKWVGLLDNVLSSTGKVQTFGEGLRQALDDAGVSVAELAKRIDFEQGTIYRWLSGKYQGPRQPTTTAKIENALALPKDALTKLVANEKFQRSYKQIPLSCWPEKIRFRVRKKALVMSLLPQNWYSLPEEERKRIFHEKVDEVVSGKYKLAQRQRAGVLGSKVYGFSLDEWPKTMRSDWEKFKIYLTSPLSLREEETRQPLSESTLFKTEEDLKYYFSYLVLSHNSDPMLNGKEMDPSELSLALLTVPDLIEDYLKFRLARSGNHNNHSVVFLSYCRKFVRPVKGYFWKNPGLAKQLPKSIQDEVEKLGGWQEYCQSSHREFTKMMGQLKSSRVVKKTRDPFAAIMPILEHSRPRELMLDAIDEFKKDVLLHHVPKRGEIPTTRQAVKWRDLLLLSMLIRWPLRRKHWQLMTYFPGRKGHLQRMENGRLQLVIPYEEFKNSGSSKQFPKRAPEEIRLRYDHFAPFREIIQLTEIYLTQYHPVLVGPSGGHLFPTEQGRGFAGVGRGISIIIEVWSETYISQFSSKPTAIPGVQPFSTHAFRHIVGTDGVKNGTLAEAAWLLVDSPEMVAKAYSHFAPVDGLERAFGNSALFRPRSLDLGGKK